MSTALGARIVCQIERHGPMRLDRYMALCLNDLEHGYYCKQDPLGPKGDFITAPEVSQVFGELVGLALAQAWIDQGRPQDAVLVELGPGRGTLMADILGVTARVSGFRKAMSVHLVENSPCLKKVQCERLGPGHTWASNVEALPEKPIFLVANEYLDALPIRQFRRSRTGWQELRVVHCGSGRLGPEWAVARLDAALPEYLKAREGDTLAGSIVEYREDADKIARVISRRIIRYGGAAILIDYGGWKSLGDTFQAVSKHGTTGPFDAPGDADLTAHVDFARIAQVAFEAGARVSPLACQRDFLRRLGIGARFRRLTRGMDHGPRSRQFAAMQRLTHRKEMGFLFKVMGITPQPVPSILGLG